MSAAAEPFERSGVARYHPLMPYSGEEMRRLTERLLGQTVTANPMKMDLGYGNENWRVECGGRTLLVKIAKQGHPVAKAESASRAQRLAHASGAPVAREVLLDTQCEAAAGRIVRILEFLPGHHPIDVLDSPASIDTFFESLGRAVAVLHSARCDGFASRVGGSPSFPTWAEYVAYRAPQIADRGRSCTLFTGTELTDALDEALCLAQQVSRVVEPRLTHRDLYLDNVLAHADGQVGALLDLDIAEPWDPVADFVKLQWQVFPRYRTAAKTFHSAYRTISADPPLFEERLRVAQILELSNHVINAQAMDHMDYAQDALRQLDHVLASAA